MSNVIIRPALSTDLGKINAVVEAAVMSWNLPERVKRLSLSSYRYNESDFAHMNIFVAVHGNDNIQGVMVLEEADNNECPNGKHGMLLHGVFVFPNQHRRGIGRKLVQTALSFAKSKVEGGLLVKAQADAVGFFQKLGFKKLPVENADRDFENRFWKEVSE